MTPDRPGRRICQRPARADSSVAHITNAVPIRKTYDRKFVKSMIATRSHYLDRRGFVAHVVVAYNDKARRLYANSDRGRTWRPVDAPERTSMSAAITAPTLDEVLEALGRELPPILYRTHKRFEEWTGISRSRISNLDAEGLGPPKVRNGRKIGYPRAALLQWLAGRMWMEDDR